MKQALVLGFLAVSLCLASAQQFIQVPIYIPAIVVNQSVPLYNNTNYPNYTAQNNLNAPPGSYGINQYPNSSQYGNFSKYPNAYNGSQDGHLFVGQIQLYDRLLFNQVYRKDSRWWTSREKVIEYPSVLPAGYTRHEIISAIRIYNQFLDGRSAQAAILKGGVGSQYVKIKLESKWNKGFQYLVQIYGH